MANKEEKKQTVLAEDNAAAPQECSEVKDSKDSKESRKESKKSEELQKKIKELETKIEEYDKKVSDSKDDYIRLMAEFETFRRRSAEDRLNLVSNASAETIKGLLPVLDDCERALAILENGADEAAKEGTTLIYSKLMDYLKTKGLSVIEAKGCKFDVDFHEAIANFPVPEEDRKGMVIDVVQTGYLLNGKVLRYAKVVVGA